MVMKLVTVVSPSHQSLLDRMTASCIGEYALKVVQIPQYGSGVFHQRGFTKAMLSKMIAIRDELSEPLLYSDADVVFLRPSLSAVLSELALHDCVFQDDGSHCCAGLFAINNTKNSFCLLDAIIKRLAGNQNDDRYDDQWILNLELKSRPLNYTRLSRKFASPYTITGSEWNGSPMQIPPETLVFHANWTIGIHNKELLLDMVTFSARRTVQ